MDGNVPEVPVRILELPESGYHDLRSVGKDSDLDRIVSIPHSDQLSIADSYYGKYIYLINIQYTAMYSFSLFN